MPEPNQYKRARFQAQRQATTAVRRALSELPEHISSKISVGVSTVTDQGLRQGSNVPSEFASVNPKAAKPVIRFRTDLTGTLVAKAPTPKEGLLSVARHEIAHVLPSGRVGHLAIAAAGGGSRRAGGALVSGVQIQHAAKFQQNPRERTRALWHSAKGTERVTTFSSDTVKKRVPPQRAPSYSTAHLRKVAKSGTPQQKKRARELRRRLRQRIESRGLR